MNRILARAARALVPIATIATIAAAPPPVAPPPHGGTIAIQPRTADGRYDRSMPAFVAAAGAALTARGFTVFDDPAHAAYVADLVLGRADVGTGLAPPNGGAKVMVGPGVIVPFSTGNSRIAALQRTRLELRIRKRAAGLVWDGTAVTVRESGTRTGTDEAVAADLSRALIAAYPVPPQSVIGVP